MAEFRLETERLTLRDWREADIAPFHAICTDPEVMATLGPPLSHAETVALVARMKAHQNEHGHCFWALERREDAGLIGWCGVIRGTAGPVAGKAEIGWRLARNCWGRGYASEAARASIGWAFENLADPAVWAITASRNGRSQAVMERLGMVRHPELDFDHPKVPDGSALKPHVTYSIARPA
jgi:RimJ/RimL family protein N-acetyltransferase